MTAQHEHASLEASDSKDTSSNFSNYYAKEITPRLAPVVQALHWMRTRFLWRAKVAGAMIIVLIGCAVLIRNVPVLTEYYEALKTSYQNIDAAYVMFLARQVSLVQWLLPNTLFYWSFPSLTALVLLGTIAVLLWTFLPGFRFEGEIKSFLMPVLLKFYGTFKENSEGGMRAACFYDSRLIPVYDSFASDGAWEGMLEDVGIEIAETEFYVTEQAREVAGFDMSDRHIVFRGLMGAAKAVRSTMLVNTGIRIVVVASSYPLKIMEKESMYELQRVRLPYQVPLYYAVYSNQPALAATFVTEELLSILHRLCMLTPELIPVSNAPSYLTRLKRKWQGEVPVAIAPFYRNYVLNHTLQFTLFDDQLLLVLPSRKPLLLPLKLFLAAHPEQDIAKYVGVIEALKQGITAVKAFQKGDIV